MDLTLQQLRMLTEVARQGTIASAAASLRYTPSAVSQQLSGLEKSTGVAVLERIGRNVRLTDAGRELVHHATDVLAHVEAAQGALERVRGEVRGELEITVYESVAATLLPALLDRLAGQHPELRLRARQADPDIAIEELASGSIELAFTTDYPHAPAPRREDITRFPLLEDRFNVVVARSDPLCARTVCLADLADRPFISSPANLSCGRCVVTACRQAGFEPDLVHQLDDYPTTLALVAAGHGIALVPDLGLVNRPDGIRVLQLDQPLSRTVQLAYRSTSATRPAIVAVRDALIALVDRFELKAA